MKLVKSKRKDYKDSVKWSINNRCNMNCSYCFLKDFTGDEVSLEEKLQAVLKLKSLNIKNFDLFGKEVLINREVFDIAEYIHNNISDSYISCITNGVNLKKYLEPMINSPIEQITLSFSGINGNRDSVIDLCAIKLLKEAKKAIEFTIDLSDNTILHLDKNIGLAFNKYSVDSVYLNPIIDIKTNKSLLLKEPLIETLKGFSNKYEDKEIYLNLPYQLKSGLKDISELCYSKNIIICGDTICNSLKGNVFYLDSELKIFGCPIASLNNNINTKKIFEVKDERELSHLILSQGDRPCQRH